MSSTSLYMLGVDHTRAPVSIREKLSFTKDEVLFFQQELIDTKIAKEVIILSTCNRTEFYIVSRFKKEVIIKWWLQAKNLTPHYGEYIYSYDEVEALAHLMRTASGLQSMVLGEPQILGQVKESYMMAMENGHISSHLNQFFEQSILAAKAIRHQTDVGRCPISVAFSAAYLAKKYYLENLNEKSILIVGAGDTARLVAMHIASMRPKRLIIVNRTLDKAKILAEKVKGEYRSLKELKDLLSDADLVVSAVSGGSYVIDKAHLNLDDKLAIPKLFIDLSVPRSIHPEINKLALTTLYGVDNLNQIINENKKLRQRASTHAERLILQMQNAYLDKLRYKKNAHKIKSLRQNTEQLALSELQKGLKRLDNGNDPYEVLTYLVHSLKNKWLHQPSISMRKAAVSGQDDLLDNAMALFGIDLDKS